MPVWRSSSILLVVVASRTPSRSFAFTKPCCSSALIRRMLGFCVWPTGCSRPSRVESALTAPRLKNPTFRASPAPASLPCSLTTWPAGCRVIIPNSIDIDWEGSDPALLGPLLSRLHAAFAEDALVEANIPFLDWFRAAKGKAKGSDLSWLISRLEKLPLPAGVISDLYAHAELALRWELDNLPTTRSNMRLPGARRFFYHTGPLLRRSDVSLEAELKSPPLVDRETTRALAANRCSIWPATPPPCAFGSCTASPTAIQREVYRAELGRGVEVFVSGVLPEHRLPLRAYHAGMFFKNAVPIGYIETLTYRQQMEVGFNLYYTFREGETAWLYCRLLRLFQQLLGVTLFTVDPYQLGLHNEEAIESGAFWFYRKLGFRPTDAVVAKLLANEEKRLRANPGYRTPARILRRLAAGWMVYGKGDRVDVRQKIRDSTLKYQFRRER